MARGFNLTAELNLRGPNNIRPVIANIRRQLSGINVDVGVRVAPSATRDIAAMQQALTRLNGTLQQTQTAAAAASNSLSALGRNVTNFNNAANNLPRTLNNTTAATNNAGNAMRQAGRTAQQAADGFESFGRQSALAIRRFAAFATVTGLIYKFTNAISSSTSEFISFNKELVRVAQVTDSSLAQLAPLVRTISSLSTGLGVTSQELITVSSTLAQAGLSARDTEKALKALALSALAPSFDSLNDTVEGSIALMRQFGIGADDLEGALGSVNAVAAKFAVEAGDLITAIQRTGGVFAASSKGVSEGKDALNEFLAVFTSIRQTTRESAETIATGLRTIFTRIQRSETIDALKEYGVVLTDLSGKFVGPYEAVRRLSEGLSKLDTRDLRFSNIVEELGGFRQIGKVIPLIQQFAVAQQALKVAQEGQSSLANDAATAQLSVANRLTKVREEFNALIRSLGESSTFQTFVKLSLDLASALIKLADSAKTVLPALTAIAAFRGAAAITRFGAGFAGGLRRQNAGGPVRGFASGGYVPGVGNGDTVPAMLTPGEFVIRKKAVESIGVNQLHSMNKKANGGAIRRYAQGGFSKTPLVDDLPNTKDAMKPIPGIGAGSILESIMRNGYGAVDFDRTLQRTVGDAAYGKAKTPQEKNAVLNRYFRDPSSRLQDVKTSRLTQFGTQLKDLIQQGKIDPKKITMISKSSRTPGIAEHIQQLFGIPTSNMVFTSGGSKEPALEAIRSKGPRISRAGKYNGGPIQKFANAGEVKQLSTQDKLNTARSQNIAPSAGGLLRDLQQNLKSVGAAVLEPESRNALSGLKFTVTQSDIEKTVGSKVKNLGFGSRTVTGHVSGLSDNTFGSFSTALDNGIVSGINTAARELATDIGMGASSIDESTKSQFLRGINTGTRGNLFEDVLTLMSGKFERTSARPFDFPDGLPSLQADDFPNLPNRWVDAKASFSRAYRSGEGSLESKTLRQISNEILAQKKKYLDLPSAANKAPSIQAALLAAGEKGLSTRELQKKFPGMKAADFMSAGGINKGGIYRVAGRAVGGSISGEDTVPALLTPGEFVINKKAASSIGASRLHQLNRADKVKGYNKGGSVGRIQRFAPGGVVESTVAGMSPKDSIRLKASIAKNAQAFEQLEKMVAGWPVEDVEMALKKLDRSLEKGASTADALASSVSAGTGGGSTRTPKKGSAPQISESIAADPRVRAMAASNQIPQTQSDTRATTNPITPRGFAASQARLNQISGNIDVYKKAEEDTYNRDTGGKRYGVGRPGGYYSQAVEDQRSKTVVGAATDRSVGYQQKAMQSSQRNYAASSFDPTQIYQGLAKLNQGIATAASSLTNMGQAAKSAGTGIIGLGKNAIGSAGRGVGGMISGIGGSALGAVGLGRFSSAGRAAAGAGGAGAAAGGAGAAGGGGMGGMGAMIATMAGGAVVDSVSKSMGGEKTDSGRKVASMGSQALNYGSMGAMMGSMFGPWGTAIGAAAGALTGLTLGFFEAEKAGKEYAQAQAQAASDLASEKSGKSLDRYMGSQTAANKQFFLSDMKATTAAEAVTGGGVTREKASSFGKFLGYQDESSADVGKRKAKTQTAGADQAEKFLAVEMMKSGKTFNELSKSMNPAEFKMLTTNIAEADERYATTQAMRANEIEKLRASGRGAEADAVQDSANKELAGLATQIASRKLAEEEAAAMAHKEAEAKKALVLVTMRAVLSLEKTFGAMDQALNKVSFNLEAAGTKREEMLSGRASMSSGNIDKDVNILQNPNAYSAADKAGAASRSTAIMGASTGGFVNRVANFSTTARDAALQRANTIQSAGAKGGDTLSQNTEIGAGVSNTLIDQIKATFGSDSAMAQTLINGVKTSVDKMVSEANAAGQSINPEDLVESAAGPLIKASEKAGELQIKALQTAQKGLVELGKTAEAVANLQQKQVNRTNNLKEMQRNGSLAFNEALGATISPQDRINNRMQSVADRVGMASGKNVTAASLAQQKSLAAQEQQRLQGQIASQEQAALGGDPAALRQLGNFQKRLAEVNNTIANTDKELEDLPQTLEGNLSDLLSEIQKKVGELEARKEAGANFAEKLVTSTPQELVELQATYKLLNDTLAGNITTINRSQVAQKAFGDALNAGKTRQEAFADAQSAFANESKKALSLFNDLTQMSGVKGEQFDRMRADLLVNTARAQGMGMENNPMFQKIIAELRRAPEDRAKNDPGVQAMLAQAGIIRDEQKAAVKEQNAADRVLQNDLLKATGDAIIKAIGETKLQIQVAVQNVARGAAAGAPFARGGVVYAANGQLINFQPKGTDTVPAMLTPGEFVINRKATQKNLPLLTKINNGEYFDEGGSVGGRMVQGVRLPTRPASPDPKIASILNNTNQSNKTLGSHTKSLNSIDNTTSKIVKDFGGQGFASGGVVYAADGKLINFQPKGTDTVPAMLTPGEFVINKKATKDNLPLLKQINSGYYAKGGKVQISEQQLLQIISQNQQNREQQEGLTADTWAVVDKKVPFSATQTLRFKDLNMFGLMDPTWKEAAKTRASSYKEALKNIQKDYFLYEPKEDKLVSGDQIQRAANADAKRLSPIDRVVAEIDYQRQNMPDIEKYMDPQTRSVDADAKNIIDQIDKAKGDPAFAQRLYEAGTSRQNFLEEVRNNLKIGDSLITKGGRSKYNKQYLENTKAWMFDQASKGVKESHYIDEVWKKIFANKKDLPALQKSNRSNFGSMDFPRAQWFDKGGIVYAQDGKKIDKASSIIANEPKALNSYLSLKGKQLGIPSDIQSVVNYLRKYNMKELERVAKKYPDIQKELNNRSSAQSSPFQTGGMVYASKGQLINFQPKGTDTVPAMLTPGEFVVNRRATQNNLPLLQSLNNGHYSSGGQVAYLANGTPGTSELTDNIRYFTEILKNGADTLSKTFQTAIAELNKVSEGATINPLQRTNGVSNNTNTANPVATMDLLGARLDRFIEQLQASIPPVIKVEGEHQVNVVINGASILQNILSGPLGNIVQQAVKSAFDAKSRKNEGN